MRRFNLLLLALILLSGCETMNDALVRYLYKDPSLSRGVRHQINEGLERREKRPPVTGPKAPAPPFMDVGWEKRQNSAELEETEVAGKETEDEFACLRR